MHLTYKKYWQIQNINETYFHNIHNSQTYKH